MTPLAVALAAVALGACSHTPGEPGRSLNESRLGIIKGSEPGVTVIGAPAAASAPTTTPAATPTAADARGRPAPSDRFAPPTGQPLRDATRLDSPSQGITLPTAPTSPEARKTPSGGG
jgi:hypothetical protein